MLVRHAKSSWDDPTLDDHDRPLAPRGRRALPRLRAHLAAGARHPEIVLCSTARRTIDTLAGIRPALADDVDVELDGALYAAGAPVLLSRIRRLDPALTCAMVIGHNPGLHDLAVSLATDATDANAGLLDRLAAKFPTGALATVVFDGDWSDLPEVGGRLADLFTPRPSRR